MKPLIILTSLFLISCYPIKQFNRSIKPTMVLIDSVDTEPIIMPEFWPDTANFYYCQLKIRGKVKYMRFLAKAGTKHVGDTVIVRKKGESY